MTPPPYENCHVMDDITCTKTLIILDKKVIITNEVNFKINR